MAERLLGTAYFWAVQLQMPEKKVRHALVDAEADGLRGESQKQFFLTTVIEALTAQEPVSAPTERLDLDQQRARLAKEQADKAAMENALRRGELADLNAVAKVWGTALGTYRARMLAAPSKLAPQVNPENPNVARDLIAAEHERILVELSSIDYAAGHGEQPPAADGPVVDSSPAPAPDSERVGGPVPSAKRRKQR